MSSTDSATSVNAAITAVDAKTGADIPVSGTDPTKINAAIAAVNAKTGADIDVSGSDSTKIDSALAALDAKTGADIPVSGSDSTKINVALSSLTTAVNSNAASINGIEDAIAIVANNNTHAAISKGQYVYVKNHGTLAEGLYKATSNIAANAALSSANLTADSSGGLNDIIYQIANPEYYNITAGNDVIIYRQKAYKFGKLVYISAYAKITGTIGTSDRLFTIPWPPETEIDIPILYVNSNKVGGLYCAGGSFQVFKNIGALANGDEIMFNCWYATT